MKITVLGCGALGQLWLAALQQQGHHVQGWLRLPHTYCNVELLQIGGSLYQQRLLANNAEHLTQSQLVIVTLKAWQVSHALIPLLPHITSDCAILLLHNGIGCSDELPPLSQPLLQGITTHGACHSNQRIIHIASGSTQIGPINTAAKTLSPLINTLHQALPSVIWHDNILPAAWQKLAANCVINPMTASYNCNNGGLYQHRIQISKVVEEISQVMNAEGYQTSTQDLLSSVFNVIELTAQNFSSMQQDITAQRHTEIDYITGFLLQRAKYHGLTLTENQRLFDMIKQKEAAYEHSIHHHLRTGLPSTRQ